MKTLIIYAHPNVQLSKYSYNLVKQIVQQNHQIDLHIISSSGNFNIKWEQEKIKNYQRLIFAFPFHWYNIPWNLKKYFDEVFSLGFAYGYEPKDFQLKNIEMTYLTTVGNSQKSYNAGEFNHFNVSEYLRCLQGTINLSSKRFLKPFIIYGAAVNQLENSDIERFANEIALTLSDPLYNPDTRYSKNKRK